MKNLLLIFFISLIPHLTLHISFAQVKGGAQQKLFDMYVLGKYEDCAFKADQMTNNEKYKKDPEPLLYLSMCMYKISKMDSTELDEHYKEPLKESLKYAKKFRAKDKDGSMHGNNPDFFDTLKIAGIEHAKSLYNQNQYAKAAAYMGMINAFDEKDDNIKLMKGVYDVLAKNAVEGSKGINDAMSGIAKSHKDSSLKNNPVSDNVLIDALLIYSNYLGKNKMDDSAKKTISIAKDIFPENDEVKNQYNRLHGISSEEKPAEEKMEEKHELHQSDEKIEISPAEKIPSDSLKTEMKEEEKIPAESKPE